MSVYINNLDLPLDGYLDLVIYGNGEVSVYDQSPQCYQETPSEARNIPPHGRLIDEADAFNVFDRLVGYLDDDMISQIKALIHRDCPTVIPASAREVRDNG